MREILPGTLCYYNEIGRIISSKESELTGNPAAINAHVGGQFFFHPHSMALEAHAHHTLYHTSLLGYLASLAEKEQLPLAELLKRFSPEKGHFIDLHEAYQELWRKSEQNKLSFSEFLDFQKNQKIGSTGYLEYTTGQKEGLTLMRNYFRNLGIPVGKDQVVMGTGFKNLYHTLMNALMTEDVGLDEKGRDIRVRKSGTILVPRGHYQSLVKAPSFHNSRIKVIERMDARHLEKELENRGDIRAAYLSVVANPSGEIMPEEQMRGIASVVLNYNQEHPDNPVYVIADQVYNGSILKEGLEIFSIASVTEDTGRMFDYTITIVSPSKTLGYASARIGFATSGIWMPGDGKSLIARMEKLLDNEGCDGIEVSNEVGVVAAYAFSSREWIDDNSAYVRSQIHRARGYVEKINHRIGRSFVELNDPDAGWYLLFKFERSNLPSCIHNSRDLMVYFMNYNHGMDDSGFISRPGAQFGYEAVHLPPLDHLILRVTTAMQPEDLEDLFRRLGDGCVKLAALEEIETLTAAEIRTLRESSADLELFLDRMEDALLVNEALPGPVEKRNLKAILRDDDNGNPEDTSAELKWFVESELTAILGE